MPGYFRFAYFDLSLVTSGGGDAPEDLVAAIVALFGASEALGPLREALYLNLAPPTTPPPYATLTQTGEMYKGMAGRGFIENKTLLFALYHDDADALAGLADAVTAVLDPLNRSKALTFDNGYLMGFRRTGGTPQRLHRLGKDGLPVWQQTYTYMVTVGRNRS